MIIEKNCAVIGYRPRKFPWGYREEDARCAALKVALIEEMIRLVEEGYTDFFSGMAEGTDTWAALSVLGLKVKKPALKLHCILPWEGQADKWSASARKLYFSILNCADEIVYVNKEYGRDCMTERDRYLVDHAACLLAVYSGEQRGRTAMAVRYARDLGKEIIVLDPGQVE